MPRPTDEEIRELAEKAVNDMGDVFYDADSFDGKGEDENDKTRNDRQREEVIECVEMAIQEAIKKAGAPAPVVLPFKATVTTVNGRDILANLHRDRPAGVSFEMIHRHLGGDIADLHRLLAETLAVAEIIVEAIEIRTGQHCLIELRKDLQGAAAYIQVRRRDK